jgi:hypothetical protein
MAIRSRRTHDALALESLSYLQAQSTYLDAKGMEAHRTPGPSSPGTNFEGPALI